MLDFGKTSYKDLVFARAQFLRFFGAPNESLRVIIMYYLFEYTFGSKIALLDSHRSQKALLRLDYGKTSYNDFVLERGEYLKLIGAPNESLGLIIIYYMFT